MSTYTKIISPFYQDIPEEISFFNKNFEIEKTESLIIDELENFDVLDVNRYKKIDLFNKVKDFVIE